MLHVSPRGSVPAHWALGVVNGVVVVIPDTSTTASGALTCAAAEAADAPASTLTSATSASTAASRTVTPMSFILNTFENLRPEVTRS